MTTARPPLDLHITVVSAKHLKNVNWRHGGVLKPYVVFWVDPDRRLSTKSDDSGSTKPVWNEHFVVPVAADESLLSLEVFHSETPKPLIGFLRLALGDLVDSENNDSSFDLRRPSGRPHGKIRLKIALRERNPPVPDYNFTPPQSFYYNSAPPPPPQYRGGYSAAAYTAATPPHTYGDPYSGYYPGGYYQQPPPPRPFFERPSAPVDYTTPSYDVKQKTVKVGGGYGGGIGVGGLAGGIGGLSLDEGMKHHHHHHHHQEDEKIGERSESDFSAGDYSDYRRFSREYK